MSSSVDSSSTTNTYPTGWIGNPTTGGGSTQSTLYLLTFLVTIVVLAVISAALLLRAYYIRRRFQRRIQEAIANGQALPPDALVGLGLARQRRGKPEKKVGPMPTIWQAEMHKDEVDEDGSKRAGDMLPERYPVTGEKPLSEDEQEWRDLTPLGMVHFPEGEIKPTPTPPTEITVPVFPPTMPRRQLLRSLFGRDTSNPLDYLQNLDLNRVKTGHTVMPAQTSYEVPEEGSEVTLGVLIAFPTEAGAGSDRWSIGEDDEEGHEVPDVCMGVMAATIAPDRNSAWG